MSKYELFCMIFYVLDAEWDETKNKHLGTFLSAANPFLFKGTGSANPAIYEHFCKIISNPITIENSYEFALHYINSLHDHGLSKAFNRINKAEWTDCVKEYLSSNHDS